VESHSGGFFPSLARVTDLEALGLVVPNIDLAYGSGNNQMLAQADVHACDWLSVEHRVDWLESWSLRATLVSVVGELNLLELVAPVDRVDIVFGFRHIQREDGV
jgi:hypothetical protein